MLTFLQDGHLPVAFRLTGILLALAVALPLSRAVLLGFASRHWPFTEATIESSEVVEDSDSDSASVRYRYSVAGRDYSGFGVSFGPSLGHDLRFGADDTVARYRPGARTRVYYDPTRPSRSVLEPGPSVACIVLLAVTAAVASFLAVGWTAS